MKKQVKTSYYVLFCIVFTQLYGSHEGIDEFRPITYLLTGKAKKGSLADGILEITRRTRLGDEAAIKCEAMLNGNTMEQQEATLNAYNAELRTLQARLLQGKQIAIDNGLDRNFKGTPSKAIAAAEMKKLQADMDEEREQQRLELERKEKLLQEQEAELAQIKDKVVVLVEKAEALSPMRRELAQQRAELDQERARERVTPLKKKVSELTARESALEAELKRLKSQMGCDVLEKILEERGDDSDDRLAGGGFAGGGVDLDNVDPLKLELASYYGKIKGISEKLGKAAAVTRDCNEIEALLKACVKLADIKEIKVGKLNPVIITEKDIYDDKLDDVLRLMKQARDIACNYREIPFEGEEKQVQDGLNVTTKWVDGHKEKMTKATSKERVNFLEQCFDISYLGAIKDEKEAIDAIDTLQLSLDLTLNFERSILSTKKLNLYLPPAFLEIDRIITSAISNFQAEIITQDKERYTSYLEELEKEKDWVQPDTNFSLCPTALHLLRNPMVLFMFKRPAKKDEADNEKTAHFASFGRISDEIRYLTENQKKALFASLYFIVFNYEEVSGKYLSETLLSNTPIQPVDIHPLIKELKESLKKNFQPLQFKPSTEQQDLAKFSVKVNDLLTGKTYREGITNRFASALISLGGKLDGISQEGIVEYLKTENLPEEQSRIANRILAEHEFISREALNQKLVTKRKSHDSYLSSLEKSILEKSQREKEALVITTKLEEGTFAKQNAQREKKEKEREIAEITEALAEDDEAKLLELGKKYEELEELDKKLLTLNNSLGKLAKESKKLDEQIAYLAKQIGSLEAIITGIEPEIADLVDTLKELGFASELERLSDDIDGIATRGNELFEFNRTLESCYELLTALQASTKKLETKATGGTSSASMAKTGKAPRHEGLEAILLKNIPGGHPQSAATNAKAKEKELKAKALAAFKAKREADELAAAEEKKKASLKEEDAPTEIFVAKKPARTALGGLVVTTAESLERELLLIESQLTLKQINEEIRRPFIERIQTIRGIIETPDSSLLNAKNTIGKLSKAIQKL